MPFLHSDNGPGKPLRWRVCLPVLMAVLGTSINAVAQQFSLIGTVKAEASPVIGASVLLVETRLGAVTDSSGAFILSRLRAGEYTLSISAVGFRTVVRAITVPDTRDVQIDLEPSTQRLEEVVILEDVFKQTQRESSVVMTKVVGEEILRRGGTTLMNSLERLPGVSSINMGVGVSKPVIRGLSFNRVVVNDAGIKQEGQQWGSDHGLEIDQFHVESVEIIRGPASLAYGSDALGGVMNIGRPAMKLPGHHEAETNLIFRSNNNTLGATTAMAGNVDGLVYKLRFTALDYGDYKVPANEFQYNRFVLPIYDNALKNTAGKERHINGTVGVQRSWGFTHVTVSSYNQKVGIFSGAMGIPRAYQLTPDGDDRNIDLPSQDVAHFKVISNTNLKLGTKWLEIDAAFQHNVRQEYSFPHAHGAPEQQHTNLALRLGLNTITLNARLLQVADNHQQITGIQSSMQENKTGGYEFLIPAYRAFQFGIFHLYQYKPSESFTFNAGVRGDYGTIQADQVRYPFYYEGNYMDSLERSPSIDRTFLNYAVGAGVSYQVNPANQLKLNIGRTFRIPAPSELTANGMHHGTFRYERGDATLDVEQGFQFDAAWLYTGGSLAVTISPFYNYFLNYIYLSPSGQFPTVEINDNVYPVAEAGQAYNFKQTSAVHMGGELEISKQLNAYMQMSVSGEYVWAENNVNGLPLPFTPPANMQATIDIAGTSVAIFKKPFVYIQYGHYWNQNRVERNEAATSGYQLASVASGFSVGKKQWLKLVVNVQNVTNTKYYNHLSRYRILNLPEPGRSISISLRCKFATSPAPRPETKQGNKRKQ
ncbi:TonB-dependent receptor [Dawidia soli]|uniref:TonB-dependent receptor n=1 Tax=Dawidia soli TaxID=2782352 RepID=A0AAP2DC58_9BACT|nr:TonB-dependent receptor [Dawidia soli]MBT1688120.1 TonB-dependent receptor [Dawidia soli]